jgi:hypothetical protein
LAAAFLAALGVPSEKREEGKVVQKAGKSVGALSLSFISSSGSRPSFVDPVVRLRLVDTLSFDVFYRCCTLLDHCVLFMSLALLGLFGLNPSGMKLRPTLTSLNESNHHFHLFQDIMLYTMTFEMISDVEVS